MSTAENTNEIRVNDRVWVPKSAVQLVFSKSSGPGGQHVNTAATRVQMKVAIADIVGLTPGARRRLGGLAGRRLDSTGILTITSESHRDQHSNRRACTERMVDLIRQSLVRPKRRIPTRASKGARERRMEEKKRRGKIKAARKYRPGRE